MVKCSACSADWRVRVRGQPARSARTTTGSTVRGEAIGLVDAAANITPPGGGSATPTLAHSCSYEGTAGPEVADPAVRIATLLDHFPLRSRLTSVCNADLTSTLDDIGMSAKQLNGRSVRRSHQVRDADLRGPRHPRLRA